MGLQIGRDAGSFEIVPATFHEISEVIHPDTGTPTLGPKEEEFCKRKFFHIMAFGQEAQTQNTTLAAETIRVGIQRDNKTLTLKPEMIMKHLGLVYGIVSINPYEFNKRYLALVLKAYV